MPNEVMSSILGTVGNIGIVAIVCVLTLHSTIGVCHAVGIRIYKISDAIDHNEAKRFSAFLAQADWKELVSRVFEKEVQFINRNNEIILSQILTITGLNVSQMGDLNSKSIELMFSPRRTESDRQNSLLEICKGPLVLTDSRGLKEPLYGEVRFYLNFSDAMSDRQTGGLVSGLMADHIRAHLPPDVIRRCVVITPSDGNVVLGLETARALRRPCLFMRERPRIEREQYWDGSFPADSIPIIVHDVAVTGEQLAAAREHLISRGLSCSHVFCLVERPEKGARQKLDSASLQLIPILQLSDSDFE